MKRIAMSILLAAALAAGVFTGCAEATTGSSSASSSASQTTTSVTTGTGNGVLETGDLFTDRDLEQTADTSNAQEITLTSGQDVNITEEGVYVISGTAENATITVAADSSAKVQIVLNGVTITNSDSAAIVVESADKVFVTTAANTTNTLTTTGTFATTAENNVDGVIFASDDIVLNGEGTLVINSSDNGIVGKDDVKITGGTYDITAVGHGIEGKDSVAIAGGTFTIAAQTDAIHAENADDASLGYVYIADGTFNLTAGSDGIEGASVVQIDGGTIAISGAEGIEGTYVQINGGTLDITANDDGINATTKSTAYNVVLEITGGATSVSMGSGDTDALDSNGDLVISGGTVDITAQSAFDYDGVGTLSGGTVTVNGEQVTELTSQMMGGMGGMGGQGSPMGGQQGQAGPTGTMQR